MGNAVPSQHPAVVLRSHFVLVRRLLAVAMVAMVALAAAVVFLATGAGEPAASATTPQFQPIVPDGWNPGTGWPDARRYDGGPEEGTRGPVPASPGPRTE
jgi:hypothetical protein